MTTLKVHEHDFYSSCTKDRPIDTEKLSVIKIYEILMANYNFHYNFALTIFAKSQGFQYAPHCSTANSKNGNKPWCTLPWKSLVYSYEETATCTFFYFFLQVTSASKLFFP